MPERERFGAIILAAGASRRMGTNKMLLPLDGEPLVRRAVRRALGAGLSPAVVVVGFEAERVRAVLDGLVYSAVTSPDPEGPTSGSLHAGLTVLPSDVAGTVVMLADMTHTSEAMLRTLADRASGSAAPLVVSRYGDVNAPPLLFRRALFGELRAWHGEGCGKAVVRAHLSEAEIVDWPRESLDDVDTPEDYARAGGVT